MIQSAVTADSRIYRLLLWFSPGALLMLAALYVSDWNQSLFLFLNHHLAIPGTFPYWALLTNLGDGFFLFPLAMCFFLKKPDQQLSVLLAMMILAISCHLFKDWFSLPRPAAILDLTDFSVIGPVLKTESFPSGHAATASLLAGLGIIYPRKWWTLLLCLLMLLVDISRVAVGAHWAADVIAGILLGLFCAVGGSWLAGKIRSGMASRGLFIVLGVVALVQLPFYDNGFQQYLSVKILAWIMTLLAAIAIVVELAELYFQYFPRHRSRLVDTCRVQGKYLVKKFFCFGLVGSSGFLIDIGVYTLFCSLFGVPHLVSRGLSYWFAASWNWFWNRALTFHDVHKSRKLTQWGKYLGVCLVSFVPNWGTYYLLTRWIPFFADYPQLALIAGVGAGMLFNFTMAFVVIFAARLPGSRVVSGETDVES